MSALPPKADIGTKQRDVGFVPKADICSAAILLFDHLVGAVKQRKRHGEAEGLDDFQVDVSNSSSLAGSSPNHFG